MLFSNVITTRKLTPTLIDHTNHITQTTFVYMIFHFSYGFVSLTFCERQTIRKTITFYVCLYTLDASNMVSLYVPTVLRICVYTNTHRFPYIFIGFRLKTI